MSPSPSQLPPSRHSPATLVLGTLACASLIAVPDATQAQANGRGQASDPDGNLTAVRCELYTARLPDAVQVVYFYLSDERRTVLQTDGNALGNVLQYTRQRVVVNKTNAEGGARTYTFDRMMGSLTVTMPAGAGAQAGTQSGAGGSMPWTMSGECQKVDASRPKF